MASRTTPSHLLTPHDLYLFNEGSHAHLYKRLGAHLGSEAGVAGAFFATWAPDARAVAVAGDFNGWNTARNPLRPVESSGIWAGFVPDAAPGDRYKFAITSRVAGPRLLRGDPFAFHTETPPLTASVVWNLAYDWGDSAWMAARADSEALRSPMSVYEVHLGSWMRVPDEENRWLTYRELAPRLADYVSSLGFTHVEFMPVMEHPFYGSWGYQVTGFFAPTSRFGTPQDFMFLVDTLHQRGTGVILDWVPSHFPADEHGLGRFDGTHLYEHADPVRGIHPDWDSLVFNYGRHEVRSFLLSSATFWLDVFHADALRVDAVASMLYLDYSREPGEWEPNAFGGREDLDALTFLRKLNETVYAQHPGAQTIAEESTAWPMVSRPTYLGGLGFGFKWDMGWMHDTLEYMRHDAVHRKYHHNLLTFRGLYGFTENFVLALSHDEVVHGKGSLLGRMPGDDWQRFANLRLLLAYQWLLPGKKLLFMGGEFGQSREWDHESSLDWHLLDHAPHRGLRDLVAGLNALYRESPALHETDCDPAGFEWLDCNDSEQSTLSFLRRSADGSVSLAIACNFTPVPRHGFAVGLPASGAWREVLNTDWSQFGGGGLANPGAFEAEPRPVHGRDHSISVTLPPLAAIVLRHEG